jgi:hypothetical protein
MTKDGRNFTSFFHDAITKETKPHKERIDLFYEAARPAGVDKATLVRRAELLSSMISHWNKILTTVTGSSDDTASHFYAR